MGVGQCGGEARGAWVSVEVKQGERGSVWRCSKGSVGQCGGAARGAWVSVEVKQGERGSVWR